MIVFGCRQGAELASESLPMGFPGCVTQWGGVGWGPGCPQHWAEGCGNHFIPVSCISGNPQSCAIFLLPIRGACNFPHEVTWLPDPFSLTTCLLRCQCTDLPASNLKLSVSSCLLGDAQGGDGLLPASPPAHSSSVKPPPPQGAQIRKSLFRSFLGPP